MRENLNRLIELQDVDDELKAIESMKGDLPQQVDVLKRELLEAETNLNNLKKELETSKRTKLHLEGEVKVQEERLKKYQNQLYAVKSNKEYDAITLETDTTKEKIDDIETKILESIESEDNLTKDVEDLEEHIKTLQENLIDKEKKLNVKIQETDSVSQILKQKRNELIGHIRKPVLYQYERIRKGKNGWAVVEINRYSCGGCFTTIPAQKALEIRSMNQLILCESCGRILVSKSQEQAVTS